jgi:sugar phosphate isomerase/epimerase
LKLITNLASYHDLPRYRDNADLKQFYRGLGLDGIELYGASDDAGIIAPDDAIGAHLRYFHDWLGLWRGDMRDVLAEHGTNEMVEHIFGGPTRDALIETIKSNIEAATAYSPEYAVFHVSNVTLEQCLTRKSKYADEEVIDGAIELINSVFTEGDYDFALLLENLWWTGLTMAKPELTMRLLDGVKYKNKGIMLDIGHLLNTNTALRTIDEGVDYINRVLDSYEDLGFIRGVHLHQSLSGEYAEQVMKNPLKVEGDYFERSMALQEHVSKIDTHKPFASKKIGAILERIKPDYLVLELISSSREEHAQYIREQMAYL